MLLSDDGLMYGSIVNVSSKRMVSYFYRTFSIYICGTKNSVNKCNTTSPYPKI